MKKALYFLAMALLAAGGFAALRRYHRRSWTALDSRDFVSGIPALEPDLKLVVARIDLVKTASAESRKVCWGVDCGTTKAALSVPARVHYAIDLSGPAPVEFHLDSRGRTFTAVFPDPEVQAVEVFSNKRKTVTEAGWARLGALSGQSLLDGLDRGLYEGIRTDASASRAVAQVKDQARPMLTRILKAYLEQMGGPSAARFELVTVSFRSDESTVDRQHVALRR